MKNFRDKNYDILYWYHVTSKLSLTFDTFLLKKERQFEKDQKTPEQRMFVEILKTHNFKKTF